MKRDAEATGARLSFWVGLFRHRTALFGLPTRELRTRSIDAWAQARAKPASAMRRRSKPPGQSSRASVPAGSVWRIASMLRQFLRQVRSVHGAFRGVGFQLRLNSRQKRTVSICRGVLII